MDPSRVRTSGVRPDSLPVRDRSAVFRASILAAALISASLAFLSASPTVQGESVSISLYGTAVGGWSFTSVGETNPGPTIAVKAGDVMTARMISEDGSPHGLFLDLDDSSRISMGDITSSSGLDVTATFTVPNAPGDHYYYCLVHSGSEYSGTFVPGAPMHGVFTVNGAPIATFAAPMATTSWTGASTRDIRFNLQDEDPPTSLTFWVNYTYGGGTQRGPIAGPIPGTPNPNVVPWTLPRINATDVLIEVTARDSTGVVGASRSSPFEVDSAPPAISGRAPSPNAMNVPRNDKIRATWSEGMDRTASAAPSAFGVQRVSDGAWSSGTASWTPDSTQMTFVPSAWLDSLTTYRVVVNTTARDDSVPGNGPSAADAWQFTTGSAADTTAPNIRSVTSSPPTQEPGGLVSVFADVIDDISVATVTARVLGMSFDANLTMVHGGGTAWYANQTYSSLGNYTVTVWATDGIGNSASRPGAFVIARARPAQPAGVIALALGDGTVRVTWSPVGEATIAGYHVHRGAAATGPYTKLTTSPVPTTGTLEYIDRNVQPGLTYHYAVSAVDSAGQESLPSAAASAAVPLPPPGGDSVLWIVAGAGIAVVALVIGVAILRRRKA